MPKKRKRMVPRTRSFTNDEQIALVELAGNWGARLTIVEDGLKILQMEPASQSEVGYGILVA